MLIAIECASILCEITSKCVALLVVVVFSMSLYTGKFRNPEVKQWVEQLKQDRTGHCVAQDSRADQQ